VAVLQVGGLQGEQLGGLDARGHVRQLEGDGLEVGDGLAELLPLLRVLHAGFVRALGDAQRQGSDGNAATVEDLHGLHEAVPDLSQNLALVNAAVVEDHLGGLGSPHAEFVLLLASPEARSAPLYDEGSHAMAVKQLPGAGDHDGYVAGNPVRDPALGSVEDPVVTILDGYALHPAGIASRVGLGQAPGPDPFAGGEFGEVFPFLLLVAELQDVAGAEGGVGSHREADGAAYLGDLLDHRDVFLVTQATAIVFLGNQHAQEALFAQFVHEVHRKVLLLVPFHDIRADMGLRKVACALADEAHVPCKMMVFTHGVWLVFLIIVFTLPNVLQQLQIFFFGRVGCRAVQHRLT